MRATGIVRRIDDLGRVVIPKEIRKTLRIREGDPLEIFTAKDGEVILKKYSPIGELNEFSQEYAETLGETLGYGVIITDLDSIISVSKLPKKLQATLRILSVPSWNFSFSLATITILPIQSPDVLIIGIIICSL